MGEVWWEQELLPLDLTMNRLMAANQQQETYDWLFSLSVSDMGQGSVLVFLMLLVTADFRFRDLRIEAILFFGGFGVIGISVVVLKLVTDRACAYEALLIQESSSAFLSGHAALPCQSSAIRIALSRRRTKHRIPLGKQTGQRRAAWPGQVGFDAWCLGRSFNRSIYKGDAVAE